MIIYNSITQQTDGSWLFSWASGLGDVRLVLFGQLIEETNGTSYEFAQNQQYADYPPPLEIVLADELALSEQNICFLNLQWHRSPCDHYSIRYYEPSTDTWRQFDIVADDAGSDVFTYTTPTISDQITTQWRIVPIDGDNREAPPLQFNAFIVRPPDPPTDLGLSCEGGTLTISQN